jgi:hypothetical protein
MCGSRPSRQFSSCRHQLLLLSPTPLSVWSLTPSLPAQRSCTRPRQCPPCRALQAPLDGARHSPTRPPGPPTSCRAIPIRGRCALLAATCATRPSSPTSAPTGLSCHRLGPRPTSYDRTTASVPFYVGRHNRWGSPPCATAPPLAGASLSAAPFGVLTPSPGPAVPWPFFSDPWPGRISPTPTQPPAQAFSTMG